MMNAESILEAGGQGRRSVSADSSSGHGVLIGPGTIRFERRLPGPIERVWSYLTESEKRSKWLAAGEMELHVGGRVEHVFRTSELTPHDDPPPAKYAHLEPEARMRGRITACEPPRLLSYTWPESGGESEVRFDLTPDGDDVLLVLTHRRLVTREDMISVAGGWHAHLDILVDRLHGRVPASFWVTTMQREAEYEERLPATGEPASVRSEGTVFQPDPTVIRWRVHFRSEPADVYRALATAEGRQRYWAESAEERDGVIHFVVPGGHECDGRILEAIPDRRFVTEYFGWKVDFDLWPADETSGTDLEMTCRGFPEGDRWEITAGWVSALLSMKAAVDFGVDLRAHDAERTWWHGFVEN